MITSSTGLVMKLREHVSIGLCTYIGRTSLDSLRREKIYLTQFENLAPGRAAVDMNVNIVDGESSLLFSIAKKPRPAHKIRPQKLYQAGTHDREEAAEPHVMYARARRK